MKPAPSRCLCAVIERRISRLELDTQAPWGSSAALATPGHLLGLFHETQGHPVALADRLDLVAIGVGNTAKIGQEGPHAAGIVLGVLRVCVDLGPLGELEARALDLLDQPLLGEVALARRVFD